MDDLNNNLLGIEEKTSIHLKCTKEDGSSFTLEELLYVLSNTQEALNEYYKVYYGIDDEKKLQQLSPEIVAVRNGCIDFSAIFAGVAANILSTLIIHGAKKIHAYFKNKKISLVYKNKNVNNKPVNAKALSSTGASFFVSYLYSLFVDNKHCNWKIIKDSRSRISNINNNPQSWITWLNQVIKMNDSKLNTNKIKLKAPIIKDMANKLLKVI